ncbi:MAG: lycopene cyclase domain-containing protein [Anaerolineae bacterium]|nr:lycopene cyclase domain-containing protein [Anaerolineae bacterium]
MTYFTFLLIFLIVPILLLGGLAWRDERGGRALPHALRGQSFWLGLAIIPFVALLYTTPWDNYLVATNVWWYKPELVTGLIIGWVPIEEYTFFILQPIFTGLVLLALLRRLPYDPKPAKGTRPRYLATLVVGLLWLGMLILLFTNYPPATYLALTLGWALPPIIFQLFFGADILWRHRYAIVTAIALPTVYLSAADTVAIYGGTWTIDPAQSLNIFLGGLPIEEAIFFLITNILVVLGLTLFCAQESQSRVPDGLRQWLHRLPQPSSSL